MHPIFSEDLIEIVESFIVESDEIFESLDNDLLLMEESLTQEAPLDGALIDQIFRAVHTVKGTAGFLSLNQLSLLAHHFEDVLNRLRRGTLTLAPGMTDIMFEAFDLMKVLVDQVRAHHLEDLDLTPMLDQLRAVAEGHVPAAATASSEAGPPDVEVAPDVDPVTDVAAEAVVDAAVEGAAADAPGLTTTPAPSTTAPEASDAHPADAAPPEDASLTQGPQPSTPTQGAADASGATSNLNKRERSETIRVDVSRLDSLMDLVGELVLGRNRLLQIVNDLTDSDQVDELVRELNETSTQVDFITTELQGAVMHTRMVQIGRVFNKFPRMIRDLAKEFSKDINLVLEGQETEVDKSLIEEISDPLIHLVRNAADHAIELPDDRTAQGKPRQGRVVLSAAHEGNHIVIKIQDDGAGMDPEKLKAKAIERKLITEKDAEEMTDAEAYQLIFAPGFSTAKKVSHVSGRGVGMDVVKTNIMRLNGTITIDSELGRGTCFTLKLPLTLAIIQSLLVRVGEETFAIPLHAILEVVGLPEDRVPTIGQREVIRLREQVVPLVKVGSTLQVPGSHASSGTGAYAVIVAIGHHRLGLVVDDLIGQKEIVIKPLGAYLKKTRGIAGSTILGDGRVIMILDVGEILRLENEHRRGEPTRLL